jgi:DNA end-binding protein Ku
MARHAVFNAGIFHRVRRHGRANTEEAPRMAARTIWKGILKIAEVNCPVALYTAASTSDRIALHTLNRTTGHRVRRLFVDSATGDPVAPEDQVKGYQVSPGDDIMLDPEEVAAAVPHGDKTLAVSAFIDCGAIDPVFFDKPYYLAPADKTAHDAFVLLREGMRRTAVAAIAQTVLFRRVRSVLIYPHGDGLIATTLHFDYEVQSSDAAFSDILALEVKGEMLDLAQHIIKTKMGKFDVSAFDDRYESALADLVTAKLAGKTIAPPPKQRPDKVVDLLAALRQSAGVADGKSKAKAPVKTAPRRKAS